MNVKRIIVTVRMDCNKRSLTHVINFLLKKGSGAYMENCEVEEGEIPEANEVECMNISNHFSQEGKCNYEKTNPFHISNPMHYSNENVPFPDLVYETPSVPEKLSKFDKTLKEAQTRVKRTKMAFSIKEQISVTVEKDEDVEWVPKSSSLVASFDSNVPESSEHSNKKKNLRRLSKTHPNRKRMLSSDTSSSISSDRSSSPESHSKYYTKKCYRSRSPSEEYSKKYRRSRSPSKKYSKKYRRSRSPSEEYSKKYRRLRSFSKEYSKKRRHSRSSSEEYSKKYRRSLSASEKLSRKYRCSRSSSEEYARKAHRSRPPSKKCYRSRSPHRLWVEKRSSTAKHSKKRQRSPSLDRHRRKRRSLLKLESSPSPVPPELSMKKLLSLNQNSQLKEIKRSPKIDPRKRTFSNSKKIKTSSPTRSPQPFHMADLKKSVGDMSLSPLSDSIPISVFETIENEYPKYGKQYKDASKPEECFGTKPGNISCQKLTWSDEEEPDENLSVVTTSEADRTRSEAFLKSKVLEEKTSEQIDKELLEWRKNTRLIFHPKNVTENSRRQIQPLGKDATRTLSKKEKLEKMLEEIEAAIKRKTMNSDT